MPIKLGNYGKLLGGVESAYYGGRLVYSADEGVLTVSPLSANVLKGNTIRFTVDGVKKPTATISDSGFTISWSGNICTIGASSSAPLGNHTIIFSNARGTQKVGVLLTVVSMALTATPPALSLTVGASGTVTITGGSGSYLATSNEQFLKVIKDTSSIFLITRVSDDLTGAGDSNSSYNKVHFTDTVTGADLTLIVNMI